MLFASIFQGIFDGDMHSRTKLPKPVSAVNKIKEALNLMRNHLFEVCWLLKGYEFVQFLHNKVIEIHPRIAMTRFQ